MRRRDWLAVVGGAAALGPAVRIGAELSRYGRMDAIGDAIDPDDGTVRRVADGTGVEPFEPVADAYLVDWPDRMRFEYDRTLRDVQHPSAYLTDVQEGDCADHGVAVASVMERRGAETRVVGGSFQDDPVDAVWPDDGHAVAEVDTGTEVLVGDVAHPRLLYRRERFAELEDTWEPTWMVGTGGDVQRYDADWPR